VIEDLISTGKSSLEVVTVLKNAGLNVVGMVSIFTYGFTVASKAFEEEGVPYKSLTNYSSLIELAVEKGLVTPETQELLLQWREDPANWKGI
jgi:orotate phosphoribosyltransferase